MVKKITKKNCKHTVIAKDILRLISEGYNSPSSMYEYLGVSKEKLNYHLKKMIEEGLVSKYSQGIYDLTEAGEKNNVTLVKDDGKKKIQLENMRFKCKLHEGLEKIMPNIKDSKRIQLNNGVTQYTGKLKNLSIRVFVSEKNQTLEITCEKKIGTNCYEIYYNARKQVENTLIEMMKENEIIFGILEPSMKPEWAIPHQYAEIILDKTESSQIRTQNGVVNRSNGRNADWEVDNIIQAEKIMNMPNDIEKIREQLVQMAQQYGTNDYKEPTSGIYM